jgi:sulfate adenylyltransferase large subunit
MREKMDVLSFVIVGHVDHGKSTLIGRLLFDTGALPADKIEEIKKASEGQGRRTEFAYLLDHLEEERKQGITIDTTQVFFTTPKRRYVIIDAPGHVEFVKNMITGASQAEAAVLIVDAEEGVKEQTKRHSYMLSMLGLKQVVVVMNKMDLVDYSQDRFNEVRDELEKWLTSIDIKIDVVIPISAIDGDNITTLSDKMPWYSGLTFLGSLDTLDSTLPPENKPLLFPIQDVYKLGDKRVNVGRVEAGTIEVGQEIAIMPGGQTTKVKTVEKFLEETTKAVASESIGMTTEDAAFLDRGDVICAPGTEPHITDSVEANMFWMSKRDFNSDTKLTMRCATQEVSCKIEKIIKRINSSTLEVVGENSDTVKNLEIAQVIIKTKKPIAIKNFNDVEELGRFVLVHDENICAGGIITKE